MRKQLGIPFEGRTDSNRWIVIDLRNDPLGAPHAYVHCDPARPYVSIALPHGIRRFEFMLFDGEAPGDEVTPEILHGILGGVIDEPERADVIRARVYTHSGRLAQRFRQGRVLLAGDAAHIMPVWQGQGYNSGMRDSANLGWKLALVVRGLADAALLDTYEQERREHARSMIALSQGVGRVLSPTNRLVAGLRDAFFRGLNYIPPVHRYIVQMRFKPMPRYRLGALTYDGPIRPHSPVGRMFPQPPVTTADQPSAMLDDVLGNAFAVVCMGVDPHHWLHPDTRAFWQRLGARIVTVWPMTQYEREAAAAPPGVLVLGDVSGRIKHWFGNHGCGVAILRPDRFVAAIGPIQRIDALTRQLATALRATHGGDDAQP